MPEALWVLAAYGLALSIARGSSTGGAVEIHRLFGRRGLNWESQVAKADQRRRLTKKRARGEEPARPLDERPERWGLATRPVSLTQLRSQPLVL
jgi:hypothetical protein